MQLQEVSNGKSHWCQVMRGLPGVGSRVVGMRQFTQWTQGELGKGQNCICKKNYRKGTYGAIEAMKCKEDSGNLPLTLALPQTDRMIVANLLAS